MTPNTGVHTCSYYCERPECVRRQRDELRGRPEAALADLATQQQGGRADGFAANRQEGE